MHTQTPQTLSAQTEMKLKSIQNRLKPYIRLTDNFQKSDIKLAAGVDLAYWTKNNIQYAACCIIVLDYQTNAVIETASSVGTVYFPYIPGFLAFRELPLILQTVQKLKQAPDVFLFDGNGILHPNQMGIATHASFYLNKPTIGVAKNYLKIQDTDFIQPGETVGDYTDIRINDQTLGRALRTRKNTKPILISCGNFLTLNTATDIVLHFITKESRIPLPTRLADIETHKVRKQENQ